jgi:hypothetical protein
MRMPPILGDQQDCQLVRREVDVRRHPGRWQCRVSLTSSHPLCFLRCLSNHAHEP